MSCKVMARKLIFAFFLLFLAQSAWTQLPVNEDEIRSMLAERGIPEDTMRARLQKKGFDPDNVKPEDLDRFQGTVLSILDEIEEEQKNKSLIEIVPVEPARKPEPEPEKKPVMPPPKQQDTTDQNKKHLIYGQEIFRNNSIAVYKKSEDVIAPDSYILDAGDRIGVVGFGRSQFEEVLEISAIGFVQPKDKLPKILLKGVTWGAAKEILFQRYSQYHVVGRGEFLATLIQPRNTTVNVFGEAVTTGAFTLPGVNTAINFISAAGGPTDIGSVRRIKVIRGNTSIPLDIYAFMNDPRIADNFYLQNNDYIHIPVAEKVVSIKGAITRPMSYELLDNENLVQLIKYAGGVAAKAYLSDVQVIRYHDSRRVITNVNLKELIEEGGDYVLYKGDVVTIKSIEEGAQNFVMVSGAVVFPGNFENKPGLRISDLLAQAVLKPEARLDFGYLLRYQPDGSYKYERVNLQAIVDNPETSTNIELNNRDRIQVMRLETFAEPQYFSVVGAVKEPSRYAFRSDGNIKVEDAILLAGGPIVEVADYGYIIRQDPSEPKMLSYIDVNIAEALAHPEGEANVEIKSGDVLQLFSKINTRDDFTVNVHGAVRSPGSFAFAPDMTLADAINLAGGFTFTADNNRIDIASIEIDDRNNQKITIQTAGLPNLEYQIENDQVVLKPFDHIYVRSIPEFEFQQIVQVEGEIKFPGAYPLLKDKERIYDIILRSGGLTGQAFPEGAKLYRSKDSIGLVVIDLDEVLGNKNSPSNIVLIGGDVIQIPKSKDLVTIEGYVNLEDAYAESYLNNSNSISVAFRGERKANYYVNRFAAGVSEEGSAGSIKVQFADGSVQKTKKFLFFHNYPRVHKGSTIIVGPKTVKPVAEVKEKKTDWATVVRDTMAQATAVLTLLILVDQLSK